MAVYFDELFATDLSGLSAETDAESDLNWSASAAMGPASGGGIATTIDNATITTGRITFTALGTGNSTISCRFWIDPNSITMGDGEEFDCWRMGNGSDANTVIMARLRYATATGYALKLISRNDAAGEHAATTVNISDGPHWVNVVAVRESADSAADGTATWYLDDTGTPVASHTSVDNYNNFLLISRFEGGMIGGHDAGTTGDYYQTAWKMSNDSTVWGGEENAAPVLTVPGAQTCTLGTQKSVTGVSVADTDGNLSTVRVQVSGSATCTVTLSGSATVTAGTNGTNDFTLGTFTDETEASTVLGTLKTDLAQVAWTDGENAPPAGHLSASTTITLTATDDEAATDQETIACNWTAANGDGTQVLILDNATLAGINAEIAASYYIPTPDTVYTSYLYVHIVDDNSNTDEVILPINVTRLGFSSPAENADHCSLSLGAHL